MTCDSRTKNENDCKDFHVINPIKKIAYTKVKLRWNGI